MATNKQVYENGEMIINYPCDEDLDGGIKSNGSIENLISYEGKTYCVITDWDNNVHLPNQNAIEVVENDVE